MDNHTPEQRRKNMKAVKNKDSEIERLLREELWSRGLRYRKNYKKIIGKPDIVFVGKKVAVFCDSEFWHGYDWENKKNEIKSRREFWIPKIERNMQRDIEVNQALESEGWTVLRFWGNDIKKKTKECADIIERAVKAEMEVFRSIDLFAGIGGIRLGFERAFKNQIETVFVSVAEREHQTVLSYTWIIKYPLNSAVITPNLICGHYANRVMKVKKRIFKIWIPN